MKGLNKMDFTNGFEIITELPRELSTQELLGRRVYREVKTKFPKIDTVGEPSDWSEYTLHLGPYQISFEKMPLLDGIRYRYLVKHNTVFLTFTEHCQPLEARTLTKHLIGEFERVQRKNN